MSLESRAKTDWRKQKKDKLKAILPECPLQPFFFSFDLKKNYWIFANRRLDPIQIHKAKDRKGNYLYVNNATWASWMVMGCFNFHEMYSWIDWLTQLMIMPSCETCPLSHGLWFKNVISNNFENQTLQPPVGVGELQTSLKMYMALH